MAHTDLTSQLTQLLEPLAESRGFELVAVEQSGGRHTPVIRVLIDREGGVNLDAILEANQWVGEALEEADPVSGPYTLEVSSPGVDRPLRKLSDFVRFAGETVNLKVRPSTGTRSAWTGVIAGVDGDSVLIEVDGENVSIPFGDVLKARLKGVVSFDRGREAD